jgi:hypothetical protein
LHVRRVIIGSFGSGLLLSALGLGFFAMRNFTLKCEDGGHPECAFIEQTAREEGRMQALGAAGCALVAGGALLFARSERKAP